VGGLLGRPSAAEPLAQRLSARIAGLRIAAAAMTNRPAVFIEIWHDPVMTVGRGAFLSELVGLAGGRNLGDEVDKDYFTVSAEWVVARNPDIILCFYMSDPDLPGRFRRRAGWEGTRAVRDGRICAGFDNDALLRPGPRVLEGIEALRACIRPGSPDG
jgi:iron complex transport system substrate-binding protein